MQNMQPSAVLNVNVYLLLLLDKILSFLAWERRDNVTLDCQIFTFGCAANCLITRKVDIDSSKVSFICECCKC